MNDLRISYIDQLKGIAILLVVLGHVIGESLRDLESFFICFDLQERIDLCSKNAREMWIDKYSEYVDRFMFSKYIPFIIN